MGYYPYVCAECGGGDVRCPTGDHEDGDCCGGCWEDDCVLFPVRAVWKSRSASGKHMPPLVKRYKATYGGYGDFTVTGAPSNVAFVTADDLSNRSLGEVVRDLDEGVEFLVACVVMCASCWAKKQKVDAAATPAPTPAGAATDDSAPTPHTPPKNGHSDD